LTNKTAVTLSFILKTETPFNLSLWEYTLNPEETLVLTVDFDPLYRDDLVSCVLEKPILIQYRGHAQRDSVKLVGEIIFPNIKFETMNVNFGSILNDTEKRIKVKLTNSSKVVAAYQWVFMENEVPNKENNKKANKGLKNLSNLQVSLPPNQVFDILPIKSTLLPGERYILSIICIYLNL